MNTYEQFFGWKSVKKGVTDVRKGKTKESFPSNDRECFALSHFVFTNET